MDDDPKRPRSDDRDFLDRLSDLDRDLPVSGGERPAAGAEADAWDDFAERRRSSAAAPRGPRPLLDLFPPVAPDPEPVQAAPPSPPPQASREVFAADEPPGDQGFEDLEDDELEPTSSARRLAALVVTFLLAMAAGATAAAYLFRDDLAAIFAAWQQTP